MRQPQLPKTVRILDGCLPIILCTAPFKRPSMFEAFSALPNTFALGYFDAFALSKQPAMGEFTCLQKVCQMMKNQGGMVTYCAQGKRKRPLQELGVHVETLAGLPGKKAMTRAWQGGCIGGIGDWQLCWLLYAIGSWL